MLKIECDHCETDLTRGVYEEKEVRWVLKQEVIPGSPLLNIAIENSTKHFCSLHCLEQWAFGKSLAEKEQF